MPPATDAPRSDPPVPPAPLDRRLLTEEILVVLSLSVLRPAAFAILSLIEAPLAGVVVAAADQSSQLARQVIGIVTALAPVFLVVHLVRRSGEGIEVIGLCRIGPPKKSRGVPFYSPSWVSPGSGSTSGRSSSA